MASSRYCQLNANSILKTQFAQTEPLDLLEVGVRVLHMDGIKNGIILKLWNWMVVRWKLEKDQSFERARYAELVWKFFP